MRRGGYGDAGGVSSGNGELPRAAPMRVQSEDQLRGEMEGISSSLAPTVDWTQRVEALLRLEGLALGGATAYPAFAECLLALRDPLFSQVLERRSAVSRQACHALSVLAELCGDRMEAVAVQLLPVLLKAIAMGIQVVTDAADACARAVLRHCHASKALPRLCGTVSGDKNGKLRQCASSYLLQVLEEWDPSLLDKHLDAVESAILAAAQDAQSDTRACGRRMYAVFGSSWPAQANSMLLRLDKNKALQEKLLQALEAHRPGLLPSESSSSLHQPHGRRSSFGHSGTQPSTPRGGARANHSLQQANGAPSGGSTASLAPRPAGVARPPGSIPVPRLALSNLSGSASPSSSAPPSLPNSARLPALPAGVTPRAVRQPPLTARAACADMLQESENQRPNSGSSMPRSGASKASMGRLGARKSMGGAALRISIAQAQASDDASSEDGSSAGQLQPGSLSARRIRAAPPAPQAAHPPISARARRQSAMPPFPRPDMATARRVEMDQSSTTESSEASDLAAPATWDDRQHAASLPQLIGQINKAGASWLDKVQLFGMLGQALQGPGSSPSPDVAASADRVAACLLDGIGDAHFKVAAAALEALGSALAGKNSKLFETHLDRLMPALFLRTADAKEQLRALANAALLEVPHRHAPDVVLGALARSLVAVRAPKVKAAVLEYFVGAATGTVDLEETLELGPGPSLRALLAAVLHLILDKNGDLRRAAARAVGVVYHAEQGGAVVGAIQALPPAEALAVQRALASAVPSLEADLAAALRASKQPGPVAAVAGAIAPASSSSSRRHSAEGLVRLPELNLALPVELLAARGPASKPQPAQGGSSGRTLPSKAGALNSPRALSSPRGVSPGKRLVTESAPSPAGPSPSMSRLGRQGSHISSNGAEADLQLSRHPSNITHTSSPVTSQPCSRASSFSQVAAVAATSPRGSPHGFSGLGRQPSTGSLPAPLPEPADTAAHAQAANPTAPSSMSDLAPFDSIMEGQLRRLLAQLGAGGSPEVFQGLSRLAHVLPGSAWTSHFSQVLSALVTALDSGSPLLARESAAMLVGDLAAAQPGLFAGPLPLLLPRLLGCMLDASREVVVAADEALDQLLGGLPPQPSLALLSHRLPQSGAQLTADPLAGGLLYAVLKNLRRVVQQLPAADAQDALPSLLPPLCATYSSPIADVRKATVDCLVALWLVAGDVILPHLSQLSASQMKLLTIYHDKALARLM